MAVAYYLSAGLLLPLLLLIVFHEAGWWALVPGREEHQFLVDAGISNRQFQIALLLASAWSCAQAARTRTVGLSALATAMLAFSGSRC